MLKENKLLIILVTSSTLMFFSIVISSVFVYQWIFALGMTQWVVVIALAVANMFKVSNISIGSFIRFNDRQLSQAIKDRKPIDIAIYSSIVPAVVIGILWIVVLLVLLWFTKIT